MRFMHKQKPRLRNLEHFRSKPELTHLCSVSSTSGTRSEIYLLPSGKWEGAIEPGAVGRLVEDALRAAHDHMLKAAPPCAAPGRYVCQRSHLQSPCSTLSQHGCMASAFPWTACLHMSASQAQSTSAQTCFVRWRDMHVLS